MQTLRHGEARGHANFGWLDSRHTFSFGHYHDPDHMGFGALRVINEDRVAAGAGFDTHGHADMEIVSYVLEGALEHRDSIGTGSVIRPGDVQRMTAGTGIRHSEFNASKSEPVHFLQIWIVPERRGLEPGYEQKAFPVAERTGAWKLVGSRDGREGSLTIHQDVDLYSGILAEGKRLDFTVGENRRVWLQVARGTLTAGGEALRAGDGLGITTAGPLALAATDDAEVLLFDLAL
ncbi:MAG: pirin family protein [Proteobacteria bacterium]|nr:pirin family protein [Pseudomonadota bacterium]MDA1071748.1 pirin family protein [Pseudomonadota bacterium]